MIEKAPLRENVIKLVLDAIKESGMSTHYFGLNFLPPHISKKNRKSYLQNFIRKKSSLTWEGFRTIEVALDNYRKHKEDPLNNGAKFSYGVKRLLIDDAQRDALIKELKEAVKQSYLSRDEFGETYIPADYNITPLSRKKYINNFLCRDCRTSEYKKDIIKATLNAYYSSRTQSVKSLEPTKIEPVEVVPEPVKVDPIKVEPAKEQTTQPTVASSLQFLVSSFFGFVTDAKQVMADVKEILEITKGNRLLLQAHGKPVPQELIHNKPLIRSRELSSDDFASGKYDIFRSH
jgi:hypothetical protein